MYTYFNHPLGEYSKEFENRADAETYLLSGGIRGGEKVLGALRTLPPADQSTRQTVVGFDFKDAPQPTSFSRALGSESENPEGRMTDAYINDPPTGNHPTPSYLAPTANMTQFPASEFPSSAPSTATQRVGQSSYSYAPQPTFGPTSSQTSGSISGGGSQAAATTFAADSSWKYGKRCWEDEWEREYWVDNVGNEYDAQGDQFWLASGGYNRLFQDPNDPNKSYVKDAPDYTKSLPGTANLS